MPNRIISRRASQKVGTAKPMKTMTAVTRSKSESCRTAESTPSGIATTKMSSMESTFRRIVIGSRSRILSATGLRSVEKETPRSSLASFPTHRIYCTGSGLSRSYMDRRRSFISTEARGFIWVWRSVGEPGARCITVKQMTVIPNRSGTMKRSLLAI